MRKLYGASKEQRIAARYIPEGSTAIEQPGGIVYTHERAGRLCALAYRGTASRAEWNHYFRTEEQRAAKIAEFFDSIKRHAEYQETRKAERKQAARDNPGSKSGDYSLTETAELVRRTLREVYPNTKFSVRSSSYSMGCSIDVRWTDGPIESEVRPILQHFEGADFDGMQDLKTLGGSTGRYVRGIRH